MDLKKLKKFYNDYKAAAPQRAAARKNLREERRQAQLERVKHKLEIERYSTELNELRTKRQQSQLDLQTKRATLQNARGEAPSLFGGFGGGSTQKDTSRSPPSAADIFGLSDKKRR